MIAYAGWPVVDRDGRVVGSVCAIDSESREWSPDDVAILEQLALACSTELGKARAFAEEGEDLARTIFDSVNVAMAFYDNRGASFSPTSSRGGWPRQRGSALRVRNEPESTSVAQTTTRSSPRGSAHRASTERRARRPGDALGGPPGKRVALAASSRQVLRPDGTAWGTLLAAHDVTDLARALQLEEDFISTVADELLTPLSAMLGHVELHLDDVEGHDVDLERTARRIHGTAIKLSNRMTELLDVADGRRKLDLRPTDLAGLTRSVVASFTAQAMARGITRLHGQRRPHSGSGCSVLHRSPQPALVVVPRAAPLTGVHSELSEHHGRSWRIEPCCSSSWRN